MSSFIGDAFAAGKRKSTTAAGPVDKKKNSKGQSFKHVLKKEDAQDSGGRSAEAATAKRSTKGMRVGVGARKSGKSEPAPYAARNAEGRSHKHVPPKANERDSGSDAYYARVHSWVGGKRKSV